MMRKLIVRLFALDYFTKAFGKTINFTRSATFIYPLFVLNSILAMSVDKFENWMIIPLIPLVMSLFFGFIYFRLFPLKVEELDLVQTWQYQQAMKNNIIPKEMDEYMMNRFIEADKYVTNIVENDEVRFYKPLLWIYHPVIIVALSLAAALIFLEL